MARIIKASTVLLAAVLLGTTVVGQEQKEKISKNKEEKNQEIIIRKKDGKTQKMTIVIEDDNVTMNGKPVDEFNNADITVLKRERSLAPAPPRVRSFRGPGAVIDGNNVDLAFPVGNRAMLGVMTEKADNGVKIMDVTKESAAEKAGLKKDDVITKVGSKEVKDPSDLVAAIRQYKPNDKVDISYLRSGKQGKITATLGESKARDFSFRLNDEDLHFNMPEGSIPNMENFNFRFNRKAKIGLQISDVEEGKGAQVKDVDDESPAAKAGLKEGDLITQVDGVEIAGVDELREKVKDLKEGDSVKLSYKRDGKTQAAEIKIPKRLKTADL